MRVQVLVVPYDSALRGFRMGAGPDRLLEAGLEARLREAGHGVRVERIEADPAAPPAEIRTAFELDRLLAARVRAASEAGWLPLVLAGNCITAVGTLAGLAAYAPGVCWFDAHGDFNTPETTEGGFLDGMALAVATGRCWTRLAASVPGFRPVPEERVVMLGTRDLDPPERAALEHSGVRVLPPDRLSSEVEPALEALAARTGDAYVHLDLDVLDPAYGRANALVAPGGPGVVEVAAALRAVRRRFRVRAMALTAYDPAHDPEGRVCVAAFDLLDVLLAPAAPPSH